MREIKFRAWDKISKAMILDVHKSDEFWIALESDRIIVMQYTRTKR